MKFILLAKVGSFHSAKSRTKRCGAAIRLIYPALSEYPKIVEKYQDLYGCFDLKLLSCRCSTSVSDSIEIVCSYWLPLASRLVSRNEIEAETAIGSCAILGGWL